jgi:peptidoglycan/LPS O-acetylase OafA/YrhL
MPKPQTPAVPPTYTSSAIHFPGLNAYRFLAASLVVLVHVEAFRRWLGLTTFGLPITDEMGGLAVTFFFVLSGFLITYLLLKEKKEFGKIAIRKFYWRRVLRIWPLYYLVVFLSFFLLNNPVIFPAIANAATYEGAPTNLLLHLAFLPNVALVMDLQIGYANQLWSIGVEEQFYLIWPLVIKYFSRRGQLLVMFGLVVFLVVAQNTVLLLLPYFPTYKVVILCLRPLLFATRIGCMAIGGVGAYLLFYHKEALSRWLSSTGIDALVVVLIVVLIAAGISIPYAKQELFGVLFCYVILSSSSKVNAILRLDNWGWNWLGQLSYGIYMWHLVVIGLLVALIKTNSILGEAQSNIILYGGTLPLTILVSWLSYTVIETPFLKLKNKFAQVYSRSS